LKEDWLLGCEIYFTGILNSNGTAPVIPALG